MEDKNKSDQKCWLIEKKEKKGELCVIYERCKGCGYCIEFCPVNALEFSKDTTERGYLLPDMVGECVLCGKCEKMCPEFAIYLKEE
ncbi:MAG: ferredoxin family protein [Thermoplasmata archaeon]